jgi:hypothetical protein
VEKEEENLNPWESETVFESWENDPGIHGHMDPRSHILRRPKVNPYKTPIYTEPGERKEAELVRGGPVKKR